MTRGYKPSELKHLLKENKQVGINKSASSIMTTTSDNLHGPADEYDMQKRVFEECERKALQQWEYGMIFPVPNGQYRAGQRMEAGLSIGSGVPDIIIAVARGKYHGAFIELKVKKNKLSPEQTDWIERLSAQHYYCAVVRDSVEQVMDIIAWYFSLGEWI